MRRVSIVILAFLSACSANDDKGAHDKPRPKIVATAAAPDVDSGQARAFDAGRGLIGTPAPAGLLTSIDGERIDLSKLYGKRPVYLKFWATWCVPCREQMPAFVRDHAQFGRDVTVIAVNTGFNETDAAIRAYRREHHLSMPIVIDDGRLAAALHLRVTPQHVVIGRDGRIAYVGHLEDDRLHRALADAIRAPGGPALASATKSIASYRVGDTTSPYAAAALDGNHVTIGGAADVPLRGLVFLSPWCESYLKSSRPKVAEACKKMRIQVDALAGLPGVRWIGIASRLWASNRELANYRDKYRTKIPLTLDTGGDLFRTYAVRDVPVVLLLDRRGKIVKRIDADPLRLPDAIHAATRVETTISSVGERAGVRHAAL